MGVLKQMGMVQPERDLKIREMQDGEDFAAWLSDLTANDPDAGYAALTEHHLVLTDEIGDWIGGIRFSIRGGVATVVDVGVVPAERGQGHALRLLQAFEAHAAEDGAHVAEFWTDQLSIEPLLAALGWTKVVSRQDYIGGRTWHLLEKRLPPADPVA
jgi:GNAT superfamily N-acetyltransferase